MIKIAPSILAADFSLLKDQMQTLNSSKADFIHLDVMDGHFVPTITFGPQLVSSIRKYTNKTFDVHLMVEDPSKYIEDFAKSGADFITVHYEADRHIDRTIQKIKSLGLKAGVAINPGTPVPLIQDIIAGLDMVLIMSVNPGFGGQKFIDYSLNKIKMLYSFKETLNPSLLIEVDGGIDKTNIKEVVSAGANVIVAGSAVFKNNEIEDNIDLLKEVLK